MERIAYGRQSVGAEDIEAVSAVLAGDFLTTGPSVDRFEGALAEVVGAKHVVAFSNGTAALHGAAAAAHLGEGKLAATSALSFVASANCARFTGASATFVDIDPATLNMDTSLVPAGLDALVPVHFAGLPVDLSAIANRPPVVIEDAAHALGAYTPDGPVGNCANSDMVCFSFHPVKPITTAEGGAVATNDDDLAHRLRRFRNHGIERRPEHGGWYYEVVETAMNYRLTDLQAALGLSQLAKLEQFIDRRREIAARYDDEFADLPVTLPPRAPEGYGHGYHLYAVRVDGRRTVYERLHEEGIAVQVHYVPIHHHRTYRDGAPDLPHTDRAYDGLLSLPVFPGLTDEQQTRVIRTFRQVIEETGAG